MVIVPVGTVQEGWMMVKVAAAGGVGWAAMITLPVAPDVHPAAFLTVKLYVPAGSPDIVVVAVLPLIAPGSIVQLPAGRPESTTLPVADAHVGCVIVPTDGAEGVAGWALMTTGVEAAEIHPVEFFTVKLYVPVARPDMVIVGVLPVTFPGLIVQVPAGRPESTTLPVADEQVGCVMVPTAGAEGGGVAVTASVPAKLYLLQPPEVILHL